MKFLSIVILFSEFFTTFCEISKNQHKCAKMTANQIFTCRSTDFQCFQRQYKSIRDRLIVGCKCMGIPPYAIFYFKHESSECVRMRGLEHSTLAGIRLDPSDHIFYWHLELPFKIQQIMDKSACPKLNKVGYNFDLIHYSYSLKRFTGNASIKVTYPYSIEKRNKEVYMKLREENLDVVLDIPDFSRYDRNSSYEKAIYEASEWAYNIVKNFDAAEYFALPFTSQLRKFMDHVALNKIFQLYPGETFKMLHFNHTQAEIYAI